MGYWISANLLSPAFMVRVQELLRKIEGLDDTISKHEDDFCGFEDRMTLKAFLSMGEDEIEDRIRNRCDLEGSLFDCIEQWLKTKIVQNLDPNFPICWTLHNNGHDDSDNSDKYITVSFQPQNENQRILAVDCGQPSSKSWSKFSDMLTFDAVSALIPPPDDPYRKNLENLAEVLGYPKSIVGVLNTLSNG